VNMLARLADRAVQAQIRLGDLVTGDHTWYERMTLEDRRNFALPTYAMLGAVTFLILALLVLIVANLIPILMTPPVRLFFYALSAAFFLCLVLFMVISVGGIVIMLVRSRPKSQKTSSPFPTRRLRRLAWVTLEASLPFAGLLLLTSDIPPYIPLLLVVGPLGLLMLSFLPLR